MEKIEKRTETFIKKYHMLREGDVVVTGVSGGADSVCLLLLLCRLQKKIGFRTVACHINHGLRGEDAEADERYVEELCGKLGVKIYIFHEDVELTARNRKQSLEEAGRMVRREAFEKVCEEEGGTKIATAHHRDDNAETVLLNMARGTGIKGICGIRPVFGKWIRPMLCLSRKEIEESLKEEGITWCTDATNSEDEYTRNRIRHNILPAFEAQVNAGTVRHLDELSVQAQEIWDYLEQGVEAAHSRCVKVSTEDGENRFLILSDRLAEEMPAIRKLLIRKCISKALGTERDLESVHVSAVLDLFEKQTGRRTNLPGQMEAVRVYSGVEIGRIKEEKETERARIELKIPGETLVPGLGCVVCRVDKKEKFILMEEIPQKSYTKCFDYDIIRRILEVRTRCPGDYLTIGPEARHQKLKSYMVNEKIPSQERNKMLLIAEGSHILWIPGKRMSSAYKVTDNTRYVLEIKIMEENKNGRKNKSVDFRGRD